MGAGLGDVIHITRTIARNGDWTDQEKGELLRLMHGLAAQNLLPETARGVSDAGDPWFVVSHPTTGEVLAHVARIAGRFVVHHMAEDLVLEGENLRELMLQVLGDPPDTRRTGSDTRPPPPLILAALVLVTDFFLSTEPVQAKEPAREEAADTVPPESSDAEDAASVVPFAEGPAVERNSARMAENAAVLDGRQNNEAARPAASERPTQTATVAWLSTLIAVSLTEGLHWPVGEGMAVATREPLGDDIGQYIAGTEGDDRVEGGATDDTIEGGGGADALHGGAGSDRLFGGDGDDRLEGGDGDDRLDGGSGNDTLHGGNGRDLLVGGDGDDVIFISTGDRAVGGHGADRFVITASLLDEWQEVAQAGQPVELKDYVADFDIATDRLDLDTRGGTVVLIPVSETGSAVIVGKNDTAGTPTPVIKPGLVLVGIDIDADGRIDFHIAERTSADTDGDGTIDAVVGHSAQPSKGALATTVSPDVPMINRTADAPASSLAALSMADPPDHDEPAVHSAFHPGDPLDPWHKNIPLPDPFWG